MDKLNIDLSILEFEAAEDYHTKAKEFLSSHQLADFRKSPWLWFKKHTGIIQERETPALLVGRAAHTRILEGRDAYELQYAFGGPINPGTGRPYGSSTKKFAEWAEQIGKPVLSHSQVELIEQMAAGLSMNDEAIELILYGQAEGVVRADYCGLPCQIRIDWLHPNRGIIDLKTCDDLTWFEADARRHGYIHQMAFYQAVLRQLLGQYVPVHLIAVEKKEPFRCGVWRLSDNALEFARSENEAAIERLIACKQSEHWPTGYEQLRVLDLA